MYTYVAFFATNIRSSNTCTLEVGCKSCKSIIDNVYVSDLGMNKEKKNIKTGLASMSYS